MNIPLRNLSNPILLIFLSILAVICFLLGITDTVDILAGIIFFCLIAGLSFAFPQHMFIGVVGISILIPLDLAIKAGALPRIGPTRVILGAFIIGYFLHLIFSRKNFFLKTHFSLGYYILAFFLVSTIGTVFSLSPLKSFYTLFSLVFEQFVIFYIFLDLLKNRRSWAQLKSVIFLITALICVYALFEEFFLYNPFPPSSAEPIFRGSLLRVRSVFYHPIALGSYLSLIFTFVLAEILQAENNMRKFIFVILIFIILSSSLLTVSRGPWMALFIEILLFVLLLKKNFKSLILIGSTSIFVFLLVLFAFSTFDLIPEYTLKILNPSNIDWRFTDEASSEYYRIALIKAVINRLQGAQWLYGLGPGTFHLAEIESTYAGHEHVLLAADSHYIRILAENGLLGLMVFFALLLGILKECVKSIKITKGKDKITSIACFASILGFVIVNITVSMFVLLPLQILFWMVAAKAITLKNKHTSNY